MKKAQSLSINVIIIAALGLAILVILMMIVTGKIGTFTKGVQAEQELHKCPGVVRDIYTCDEPILGNYGKLDQKTQKLVKFSPTDVCCKK